MKKIMILIASFVSMSAMADSEVVCKDSIDVSRTNTYVGAYDQAIKDLNETINKIGAKTVSAPSLVLRANNTGVICVTITK